MHGDATLGPPTLADGPSTLDEPTPALRCVICHDDLQAWAARRCAGCRTLFHAECLAELGRAGCATLGCSGRRRSPVHPVGRPVSPVERRSLWLLVPGLATLAGTGVVAGVVGLIAAWVNRGHRFEPLWLLGALACLAVHAVLLPGAWLATLRGRGFSDGLRAAATCALALLPLALLFAGGDDDAKAFAAGAALLEPFLATLILGVAARVGRGPGQAAGPGPRVQVRARPLAFAAA